MYVATPLSEYEKRDPKGLYARARSRELTGVTGVDAPYEPPENADLALDTAGATLEDIIARVLAVLDENSPRRNCDREGWSDSRFRTAGTIGLLSRQIRTAHPQRSRAEPAAYRMDHTRKFRPCPIFRTFTAVLQEFYAS